MTKPLAAIPTARRIQTMSAQQLVAQFRAARKQLTIDKLVGNNPDRLNRYVLALQTELKRRNITINDPELLE